MSQERMEASKPKNVFSGLGGGVAQAEQVVVQTQSLANKIRVVNGANERYFDNLAGKDVGYVRKALKDAFNIPGDATALVGGKQVGDEFLLEAGQNLEFVKEAGQKGYIVVATVDPVYLHLFNGGVTFSVKDKGNGPQIEIDQSYFGNMVNSLQIMTDKDSLRKLGEMFLEAAAKDYSNDYCHKVSVDKKGECSG